MKFLPTPPLSVPSHCTPANHYFKSTVSADTHDKEHVIKTGQAAPSLALEHHSCRHTLRTQTRQIKQKTSHLSPDSFHSWNTHPEEHWPRWGCRGVLVAIPFAWTQQWQRHEKEQQFPGSSWASHKEIYSFTMEDVFRFSGGRQQTCPRHMPTWLILCFCWLKTIKALHLSPQP